MRSDKVVVYSTITLITAMLIALVMFYRLWYESTFVEVELGINEVWCLSDDIISNKEVIINTKGLVKSIKYNTDGTMVVIFYKEKVAR